jgi:dehydrogenase/reductase SDR family member 4
MKGHTTKKVAVIQAGTSGIGLATARRLLTDGYFVVVSSRREANVARALASLKRNGVDVIGVVGHAGREEDRVKLADTATSLRADGAVHALVCNAATSITYGPLLETDAGAWAKMLDTNVSAAMLTVRALARRNAFASGAAAVVLVASIGGYAPLPGLGAYSVTKTALLGLCRALAEELAPAVRVNCVAPGIIRTKFSETLWRAWDDDDDDGGGGGDATTTSDAPGDGGDAVVRNIGAPTTPRRTAARKRPFQLPLDRLGTPEDVSGVVAFLLSDDAAYVTGETVVVAGGLRSRL